jgi:uncharacterized membrane protein YoaK (UPF0700 family)
VIVSLDHSKIKAPAISDNTRDLLFVVLTSAAGSVDALSLFGLGGVFASALSGNTVVLGASLVQGESMRAYLGIIVFVGYILGAALAAFLLRQEIRSTVGWSTRVTRTLGIELILLLGLFLSTYLDSGLVFLVLLAAFSMGIQFICAKHVNRSGVVTTMITGTLSSLISRLVDRRKSISAAADQDNSESLTLADGNKHRLKSSTETTLFLVVVWGGYFAGAISSAAALFFVSRTASAAIPFVLLFLVVSYAGISQRRLNT